MDREYLNSDDITGYILASWSKCVERNLPRDGENIFNYSEAGSSKLDIDLFRELVSFVNIFIKGDILFLLTDKDMILLDFAGSKTVQNKISEKGIKKGFSFSENCIGTNAISVSAHFKKPVLLKAKHNYSNFLRDYESFALPLWFNKLIEGYFCTMVFDKDFNRNIILITELLAYIIAGGKYTVSTSKLQNYNLSEHQLKVLKLIAGGLTEEAIADRLKLSKNTIKYHKKVLVEKLNVQSIIEAVIRALKLGLFSVDEIKLDI